MHVRTMEIAGRDLPEVLLAIYNVSRQIVKPSPGRVGQVDGEKLDDEKVIIGPNCLASKAVVLQLDAGVVLPLYLTTLLGAQKCFGKCVSCTMLPNAFDPETSGVRLHPS
jgi:hypothetical protein